MNRDLKIEKVILSIDTSNYDTLVVGLEIGGNTKIIKEDFDYHKSQGVLPLIEKVIKANSLSFSDITAIKVTTGPGSFTGLRVGVSIANTLGSLLHVPINGQPAGLLVEPQYTEAN